jgi:rhodanese-related sulfurtransferase
MFRRITVAFLCCLLSLTVATSLFAQAQAPEKKAPAAATAPEKKPEIPQKKQTTLGLYVTAKQAYAMWQKDKNIKILDCRTPEEYAFLGHAPMAYNIPSKFMQYRWDAKKKFYLMQDNRKFVRQAKKVFKPTDTILIMCRSGARSASSVNKLAKAGFNNVYNIYDGFEGDKVKDKNSPQFGKRTKNGWRNSGAPWTYHLDTSLMYLPYGKPKNK